tara:strand:- start:874 stop:1119 length:246 start_codon:yes stop_codon:yes gene_type:complete
MTTTNVNDIQVDVNQIAEDMVQRKHEDIPYNATGLVVSLLEDVHSCLDSKDCDWYTDIDGVPMVTLCVIDTIAQEQINTII